MIIFRFFYEAIMIDTLEYNVASREFIFAHLHQKKFGTNFRANPLRVCSTSGELNLKSTPGKSYTLL